MRQELAKAKSLFDIKERFRHLALLYTELLAAEGVRARPFRSPELPVLSKLPVEQQESATQHLGTALEIFAETREEGFSLKDSPRLLWRALRKLGWIPQGDIFDKITDDDVVVVYSPEQKQMFQNLRFFDFVSLTLEELYGQVWQQYSRRDHSVALALHGLGVKLFSGQITGTMETGVPEHLCEEIDTVEMLKFNIDVRLLSPLRSGGVACGVIAVNRCRLVSPS